MSMDPKENADHHGRKDQHNPGSIAEFCDRKNKHDNGCAERAKPIADHLQEPALFITQDMSRFVCSIRRSAIWLKTSRAPPAARHPCLCKCKGKEYTNCIKRDQTSNT